MGPSSPLQASPPHHPPASMTLLPLSFCHVSLANTALNFSGFQSLVSHGFLLPSQAFPCPSSAFAHPPFPPQTVPCRHTAAAGPSAFPKPLSLRRSLSPFHRRFLLASASCPASPGFPGASSSKHTLSPDISRLSSHGCLPSSYTYNTFSLLTKQTKKAKLQGQKKIGGHQGSGQGERKNGWHRAFLGRSS